jgi:hypothetical protein
MIDRKMTHVLFNSLFFMPIKIFQDLWLGIIVLTSLEALASASKA